MSLGQIRHIHPIWSVYQTSIDTPHHLKPKIILILLILYRRLSARSTRINLDRLGLNNPRVSISITRLDNLLGETIFPIAIRKLIYIMQSSQRRNLRLAFESARTLNLRIILGTVHRRWLENRGITLRRTSSRIKIADMISFIFDSSSGTVDRNSFCCIF